LRKASQNEEEANHMVSLAQLQEIPPKNVILLVGAPGSGKSTFCQQAILQGIAMDRPVIYVITECDPSEAENSLRERGLHEVEPGLLNFVDAYNETVGVPVSDRPDTIQGRKDILSVFDSLTSPYLFSGTEILRFMRQTLSRFAAKGNAVVASIDEGCGREEDIVSMMSLSNGVIKMETEENKLLLNVVKHPKLRPTKIEVPIEPKRGLETRIFDLSSLKQLCQAMVLGGETAMRREVGDYMNLFWPNLAHWSGMLWDPKRFPIMTYELNKEDAPSMFKLCKEDEAVKRAYFPWQVRLLMKFLMPRSFSKVKDMKKARFLERLEKERTGIIEYLGDTSRTDEHYIRVYESSDCWGFENVGSTMASYLPPLIAGMCKGFEYWKGLERDWNAVETKCTALGYPYCEFKLVPGEIDGLKDSLQKDSSIIEMIHDRLLHRLIGFLLDGKPLVDRPRLGSDIYLHAVGHAMGFPHLAGERYRMAVRMGGAKTGKEVGENLMDTGVGEDEAVKRILGFLEHCKVGKITAGETIKITDNCESSYTRIFATKWNEPSCFFTTGFLNGFFYTVKNKHVKEIKCIAAGDSYCEWEYR